MTDEHDTRLRRLKMRSMRRGTKEMDLILMRFSDLRLAGMENAALDTYEALLSENDQDIYSWIIGQNDAPEQFQQMISEIVEIAEGIVRVS